MAMARSKKMPGRASKRNCFRQFVPVIYMLLSVRGVYGDRNDGNNLAERFQFFFTREAYNASIQEGSAAKTYVNLNVKMGIALREPLNVQYKIIGGDTKGLFQTESRTVGDFCFLHIRTHTGYEVLNRERTDRYTLQIKASSRLKSVNQRITAQTTVHVEVLDINDLSPIFDENRYSVVIPENTALHTSIVRVGATDADIGVNGDIYYSFVNMNDTFAIHPTRGVVTVTRPLNFMEKNHYEIDVIARDRGLNVLGSGIGQGRSRKTRLTVGIQQVNAHAPSISVQNLPEIMEHGLVGTVYAILYVSDKDFGENGEIESVNIVSGDPNDNFRLLKRGNDGQSEYQIQVTKAIDRKVAPDGFNLTVRATDKGSPKKSSTASILVSLAERSSTEPSFTQELFEVSVDECVPPRTQITFIKAKDWNEGRQLIYRIIRGNELNLFSIHARTGLISVERSLDTEKNSQIELTVSVEEQGRVGSQKVAQAVVRINIADCNDNSPVFSETNPSATIDENLSIGTSFYRVVATDLDSGDNGFLSYSIANTDSVPFDIDHYTGAVTVTDVLDFETMRRTYFLLIRASDWGTPFRRESEIVLKVQLRDVNDNQPGFEKVDCSGHLSREAPVGTTVTAISAIDFDAGNIISYQIISGNDDDCFEMLSASGVIKTKCDLRNSPQSLRSLVVQAMDGEHFSDPTTVNLTLVNNKRSRALSNRDANVVCRNTDIAIAYQRQLRESERNNDNTRSHDFDYIISPIVQNSQAPRFPHTVEERISIPENIEVGKEVYNFDAQDDDEGYNSLLMYSIADGNNDCKFNISAYTGSLYVVLPIDREEKYEFSLNVTVTDMGSPAKASFHIFTVDISDVNDNEPTFERDNYRVEVPEDIPVGRSVLRVRASDRDSGQNSVITYSIRTDTDKFRIDPESGVLYIAVALDREDLDVHELAVQAQDGGSPSLYSVVMVRVTVADINDNGPVFLPSSYHVHIREDLPLGAIVTTLTAYDSDLQGGGSVRYNLLEGMDTNFEIDPHTGVIRIVKPLDYEQKQVYNMTARAKDRGVPSLFSKCVVVVEIVDVDENLFTPKFSDYVFSAHVAENRERGTEVTRLVASDKDVVNPLASPKDYDVTYFITGGDGIGKFIIDNTGVIRTNAVLDRESKWYYWLTVVAQDQGAVPRSSQAEVYIRVDDVNDNKPRTALPVYYPTVMENSEQGVPVRQLSATDMDASANNQLTYTITSGNPQGFFTIDESQGLISTTTRTLDREKQEEHILEVTIRDSGSPQLSSTTRVVVEVKDENDNAPEFMEFAYRVPIPEMPTATYDVPLHRVIAFDADSGDNADIDYSITSGKGSGRFKIHPKTGMIYSQKEFTAGMRFDLIVQAIDNGRPKQKEASVHVTFTVQPRPVDSPHPPVFRRRGGREEVPEDMEVGRPISTSQASDEDGDTIWYSIVGGNEGDVFSIHSLMGSVLLARPLDRERNAEYNLTIQASDAVHYIQTWLYIKVLDRNDNRPVFDQDSYEVSVSEDIPPGTNFLTLTATDEDEDKRLFYTLHGVADEGSHGKFQIDSETGVLSTIGALNRESISQHELTIMVRDDQGVKSKRSLARVKVLVDDYNDHAPEFLADRFEGAVYETAAMGTIVVKVTAMDRDHGRNAELTYRIISGNIGNAFTIDDRLGDIAVSKALDRHVHATYSLTVQAIDGGTPSLSATTTVTINVTVSDNAAPKFKVREYTTEIEENRPEVTFIIAVTATSKSSVVYEITHGNEDSSFLINPSSGVIKSNKQFDFEKQEFYNLTVTARNVVNSYAEVSVLVHIIDMNDNAPVFSQLTYSGNISEAASPGSVVLDGESSPLVIKATDLDSDRNSLLSYSIVEKEAENLFEIDPNTGAVKIRNSLDHEESHEYTFQVQVKDQGVPCRSAEVAALVVVHVSDINDSPPMFDQSVYEATILLPTYTDVLVIGTSATDADSPINGQLTYSLASGNSEGHFKIDSHTGDITVAKATDMLDEYELTVKVTDGVFESTCSVSVRVDLTQNRGLVFTQEQYTATVVENSTTTERVTVVQARGHDLNEHLMFSILNPSDMFQIGETSGVIQSTGMPFDREIQDFYTLVVEVRDGREPPRLAHALVQVHVTDINDNWPVFVRQPYYTVVSLDARSGDVVRQVYAIDRDTGENGSITYSIRGSTSKFLIDETTGTIFVKAGFSSADENQQFILTVQATDMGYEQHSTRVEVRITVKNKNTPVFAEQFYSVEVPEDIELGSAILDVEAESPTGRKLIYSISEGNVYGEFDIQFDIDMAVLGPCSITVVDTLDYENQKQYELTVRATDTLTGSYAEIKVEINLKDVNDNAPTFEMLQYTSHVSEASPVGTSVMAVSAFDADSAINAKVHYSILPVDVNSHDSRYFHIEPDSGVVLSKQKFDHEEKSLLVFVVMATDSGNPPMSSSVVVKINVTDMNDNPPRFDQPAYDVFVTDLAKRGQFVTIVSASDADSTVGGMRFSIVGGNERQAFDIDETSGIISLSSLRTPDLMASYILNVSVTDGVFTNFARVQVTVRNSNSHVPMFEHTLYDVDVSENLPRNTKVASLSASDADQGIYGDVTYYIDSEEMKDVFTIDRETGELFTAIVLDREESSQYVVPVAAQDGGGRAGYSTVRVNVADQGDNKPHFLLSNYRANVYSNADEQTVIIKVTALDKDLGTNGDLDYSLYDGDGIPASDWFDIDRNTGSIRVKKSLESKENVMFEFFVRVTDKGSPPRENDVPVEILVMSPAETVPEFPKDSYSYFISEDRLTGSIIATVKARSNESVVYSIVSGDTPHTNTPAKFDIDTEGKISVIEALDREELEMFELTVMASTRSTPPLVAYCLVTVQIMDVNDNSPRFESDPYAVAVAENAAIGSSVIQVIAHDADTGSNADITYAFAPEHTGMSNVFFLDPESGWITTLTELDREAEDMYAFSVVARDRGSRIQLSDVTSVRIAIMDHNDEPPVFNVDIYQGQVAEDALLGTVVLSVRTTDGDLDSNADVAYNIVGGDTLGQFAIRNKGEIFVNKNLDRERNAYYELEIAATDGAFVSTALVRITILDANDNAPQCERPLYRKAIREDYPVGSFIIKVSASDADEPNSPNSDLLYELEDTHGMFNVRRKTGIITNVRAFDRETTPKYRLRVIVSDGGGLQCAMEVLVTLTDINDNSPVFQGRQQPISILENAPVNTTLTRVTATDVDVGINRLVMYELSSDSKEHFKIDRISGILSVHRLLDRERQDTHNITIYAHDQGTPKMTAVTHIIVTLLDVNDNPPEFEHVTYSQVVSEAMAVGSDVIRVFATSRDTGVNAEIEYSIVAGNRGGHFDIDPRTGTVSLLSELDYEHAREYTLTIEARDKGEPPLSNRATLRVNVTDHNDNAPQFTRERYEASVRENLAVGTEVIKVLATDLDSEPNAMVTYYIVGGDPQHNFAMNQQSGALTINKDLDREQVDTYMLDIHAIDQGQPQLTGSTQIRLTLLDVNDCPPQLESSNYSANVQEDRDIGHKVLELRVTDADLDPNGAPFTYDIIDGNYGNEFLINRDGVISTTALFDRNIKDTYQLTIRVFDNGEMPLYVDTVVNVNIIEESAFPPIVTPLTATVTADWELCDAYIGRIKALDKDPYDMLTYDIVSRNKDYFSVHSQDGTLRVVDCIDPGQYSLNVSVTDGKYVAYGSVDLRVSAIDEELANEAVVIRLQNMLPEEFITTHRDGLIRYLQEVFNVAQSDVHILSIQGSSDDVREPSTRKRRSTGSDLDILVAIGNVDSEVWRRNKVYKVLNRAKGDLKSELGLTVVAVINDVCPAGACENGECDTVVYFSEDDESPIITERESYVSAKHQLGFVCRCRTGFGGTRCEERVDYCQSNPCPPTHVCVAGNMDFMCRCPPGFFGQDCEYTEDCRDRDCIEEQPLAFSGSSYIAWRVTVSMQRQLYVSLDVKTVQKSARLMHAVGSLDYSILEMENGFIQYRFDCGSGEGLAKSNSVRVNDGLWHSILVERNSRNVKLTIDGRYTAEGSAPGSNAVLNLDNDEVYFGGEVAASDVHSGFVGCMRGISIDNERLPLTGSNSVGVLQQLSNVEFQCRGLYLDGICAANSCDNGGTCLMVGRDQHMCKCLNRYAGARCEVDSNPCVSNPCLHGGVCEKMGTDFRCDCRANYKGKRCELTSFCDSNPCLHGSQCSEMATGPVCTCLGFEGEFCQYDIDECAQKPCRNGATCLNTIGSFKCNCTNQAAGQLCDELVVPKVSKGTLIFGLGLQEFVGIIAAVVVILLLVIIFALLLRRRRSKRQYHQAPSEPLEKERHAKALFYSEDDLKKRSKMDSVEDNRMNVVPSPQTRRSPPPVPARPASYTPSAGESINTLSNAHGLDAARNYGSAADDLNNMSTIQEPIQIPDFLTNCDVDKPLLDKSPPPPPRKMDSHSNKRGWDPNINFPDVHKKSHKIMPSDHQSAESIQLLQRGSHGDSVASLPITEGDEDMMQGYHWDTSDWHPTYQVPRPEISELPGNSVHTTPAKHSMPSASNRYSLGPDNITIDPENDYSYTDFQEDDDFIDSEYVGDSEFTENECGSDLDTGDDLDDDFDPPDYQDILASGLDKYLPHYSDIEPSQADSNWGSRDNELNANFDSANNLTEGDVLHYGFSLPRPRDKHPRQLKPDNRFSGDFTMEYEKTTGAIPMDDLSVAGYASMSSIGNVCEIEDSEANLSDSDSSNESMRLVKSSTNLHTVV